MRAQTSQAYQPFFFALALLACGLLLPIVPGFALRHDPGLLRALLHAELALPLFLFMPQVRRGRVAALQSMAMAAACWACSGAMLAAFTFVGGADLLLASRVDSALAWLMLCGPIALGAQFSVTWRERARLVLLVVAALPVLWHYFGLEYSGASLLALRGTSPHWALAAAQPLAWPAGVIGLAAFAGALLVPHPRQAEAT